MMRQALETMSVRTRDRGFYEITREVQARVRQTAVQTGLCTLHLQHTSASLLIQENYSPDVRRDLEEFLDRLAPQDPSRYRHNDEGPDDMPAHLKAALTQVTLTIPVIDARLQLGTWQGVFLLEHRDRPHRRELVLTLIGT
jgi:secondary thiamine-phosphate synthase enzyme